jgi:hypothetical protein
MLTKSRTSALAMAAIALLAALAVSIAWLGVTRFLQIGAAGGSAAAGRTVLSWLLLLVLLGVSVGLISLPIYQLDDAHFGWRGAVRWAIAGALYGALWRAISQLIPGEVLKLALQPFLISLSYWAVFRLFPPARDEGE